MIAASTFPHTRSQKIRFKEWIANLRRFDRYDALVLLGVCIYSVLFSFLSLFKYKTFQYEYDLAAFNLAFVNSVQYGNWLSDSLENGSHFAIHFSPILFSLIPAYALFPGPATLLIAQSILLGLGAIPVYLCGREILGKKEGTVLGLIYLLYPALHGANLYDFHEVAFLPLLVGMTFWCYLTERKTPLLICAILSLCVKEDVSLLIGMIGLLGLYKTRNDALSERWQYIVLLLLPLITLGSFFFLIKPFFASAGSAPAPNFLGQYSDPVSSILKSNSYVLRFVYILECFLPLLFIAFLSLETLVISAPSFIEILLSGSRYYSVWFHYSALIIPGVFFATIMGLYRLQEREKRSGRRLMPIVLVLLILSSIFCTLAYSPAVRQSSLIGGFDEHALDTHREYVNTVASVIPKNASISTQYNMLPFLSDHPKLSVNTIGDTDIILGNTAFAWRAEDILKNQTEIDRDYNLLLNRNHLELYVSKKNQGLQTELAGSLGLR